jgi:hypothetical protein
MDNLKYRRPPLVFCRFKGHVYPSGLLPSVDILRTNGAD